MENEVKVETGSLAVGVVIDSSPLPCCRCGKNMRDSRTGSAFIGIMIQVKDEQNDPEYSAFLQSQMGDFIIGEDYSFCFECFIKALMKK